VRVAGYRDIADYGLIGDGRTAALVAADGSIDWFCWPRFDSPSVFARLLDAERGGFWQVVPVDAHVDGAMRYRPQTAILETEHRTASGRVRVTDAAAAPELGRGHTRIVRLVEGLEGEVEMQSVVDARPAYGESSPTVRTGRGVAELSADGFFGRLGVTGGDAVAELHGAVLRHRFRMRAGEQVALNLVCGEDAGDLHRATETIEACDEFWRHWCTLCRFEGEFADAVQRSAITLKLMAHVDSGAIVAAPTTSLPEDVGGVRNWDYRYTWLRDASWTVYGLLSTAQEHEAAPFMHWVCDRVGELADVADLQIMYALDGESDLPERELDHLEGYRASRPVRIGNQAAEQLQLDVYGEVVDCLAICNSHDLGFTEEVWPDFRRVVDWVAEHWRRPDNGIWEVRGGRRHFVFSKVMAWVALNRGCLLVERAGLDGDAERWSREAAELHAEVLERGWSERMQAFRQSYEDDKLDAANLLMPIVGFLPPDDARVHATIDATVQRLTDRGLVYRYRGADDGLPGEEGTFTICTLWLASAMAVCGRVAEAREVFERVLSYAGPLALFSEEIDPRTGAALGNYPQAFTHIGLIGAAVHLARAGAIDARAGADIGLPGVQGSEARARVGEDRGPRRRGARSDAHEHQQGGLADG
jgi:GH15 family glucan-1,4-alpha-glucosidase